MVPESNSIDAIPSRGRFQLPELLIVSLHDCGHTSISIVDQDIQLPALLFVDPLEQTFYLFILVVIQDDGNGFPAPLLDLLGSSIQVGLAAS